MTSLTNLTTELSSVVNLVNSFKSESVQLEVIKHILETLSPTLKVPKLLRPDDMMFTKPRYGVAYPDPTAVATHWANHECSNFAPESIRPANRRTAGATKLIQQLLQTDFFKNERSILQITTELKDISGRDFNTSEVSGVLLSNIQNGKLIRVSASGGRYKYMFPEPTTKLEKLIDEINTMLPEGEGIGQKVL